jgi:hypothetical protein
MKSMDIVCVAQCCVCDVHCDVHYKVLKFDNFVVCICVHNVHSCLCIFKICMCFLCAFCNAQSQSMNFNTQGCYITTWYALSIFGVCTFARNSNCVHQLGIQICYQRLSIVRIKWDSVYNVHVELLKLI